MSVSGVSVGTRVSVLGLVCVSLVCVLALCLGVSWRSGCVLYSLVCVCLGPLVCACVLLVCSGLPVWEPWGDTFCSLVCVGGGSCNPSRVLLIGLYGEVAPLVWEDGSHLWGSIPRPAQRLCSAFWYVEAVTMMLSATHVLCR